MIHQKAYSYSHDKLIRLDIHKNVHFEGNGYYAYTVVSNKQVVCFTKNLFHAEKALASQLGEQIKCFMRTDRQFVINMNYICQDAQRQTLTLADCEHFSLLKPVFKKASKTYHLNQNINNGDY